MRLSSGLLLSAYCQGIFPMADENGQIHWYDPDPRAILPIDDFHVPRRLKRSVKRFEVRCDTDFSGVIRACARTYTGRDETWISEEIIQAYLRLHELGFAHSVECWQTDALVGGLYGVSIHGLFAGESMFSLVRDASKVALHALVEHLRQAGFLLLDIQFMTEHLRQFGAKEISREAYKSRLSKALASTAQF